MSKRFPTVLIASACFLLIVGGLVAHAFLFAAYQAGDLNYYVIPWLEQLRVEGFGKPVGNYAPPYLYLLCSHGVPIPACADGFLRRPHV
jgi:hypothetical protein